jgi:hypothetical protein
MNPNLIPDFYIGFSGMEFTINVPERLGMEDATIRPTLFCRFNEKRFCYGFNSGEHSISVARASATVAFAKA